MIADLPDVDETQTAGGRATVRAFWVPAAALVALLVGLLITPASAVPITPSNSRILAKWTSRETLLTSRAGARMSFRHGDPWPDCCFARVAVWGAIDARQPVDANGDRIPDRPQVFFRKDYSAPRPLKAKGMVCLPARGVPRLPMLIRICRAPDGTYWTLQRFRRLMRNFGGADAKPELWPSHFTFPVAKFESLGVDGNMISGRLTYRGRGVHGFRSTSTGVPLDGYGRSIYLDVLNGPYGRGWRRESRFATQAPSGRFEYRLANGKGDRYRVTAVGPGVTPIVRGEFGP